jgi:hypothetical protein
MSFLDDVANIFFCSMFRILLIFALRPLAVEQPGSGGTKGGSNFLTIFTNFDIFGPLFDNFLTIFDNF